MGTRAFKFLILFLLSTNQTSACASHGLDGLSLSAELRDGVFIAQLKNSASEEVSVVGEYQSIDPSSMDGFYIEVKDEHENIKRYCGMINQEKPKMVSINPHKSLVFGVDAWIVKESHCLTPGQYVLRVRYSSDMGGGSDRVLLYSESVKFKIDGVRVIDPGGDRKSLALWHGVRRQLFRAIADPSLSRRSMGSESFVDRWGQIDGVRVIDPGGDRKSLAL